MSNIRGSLVSGFYGVRSTFAFRAFVLVAALLACSGSETGLTSPTGRSPAAIVITPDAPTLSPGSRIALQAAVHDASGQLVSGASVFWSSSDTNVVAVDASTGVVTAKTVGTAQIAASSGGQSSVVPVSVVPMAVASVAVLPSTATVIVGGTVSLQTVAYDASGNTLSGRSVVWASSASQVASVDQSGNVTGVSAGNATITGTIEGKSAPAAITVTVVPVAAVSVTPGSAALTVGQSASFSATTTDANGNVLSGRQIKWSSANNSVATVSAQGLVNAVAAGNTSVTATSEGMSATAQLSVTSPTPPPPVPAASVAVNPSSASLAIGATTTLSATVRDASGATLSGRSVTWSTSSSQTASVSSSGVVTAIATGTATITATSEGKTGSSTISVQPVPVASVTVSPTTANVIVGGTVTLYATERDANNGTLSGRSVTWSSNAPQVATVSGNGLVATVGVGTATITATSEGKSATAGITVQPVPIAPVASVGVSPGSATIAIGGTVTFSAIERDANGGTLSGRSVSWSSSAPQVATVSGSGVVTAVTAGTTTITATSEGRSATATITVPQPPPAAVASVRVTPVTLTLHHNQNATLTAQTLDANGNVLTGRTITWTINSTDEGDNNNNMISLTPSGATTVVLAHNHNGSVTITATSGEVHGTATVTVTN